MKEIIILFAVTFFTLLLIGLLLVLGVGLDFLSNGFTGIKEIFYNFYFYIIIILLGFLSTFYFLFIIRHIRIYLIAKHEKEQAEKKLQKEEIDEVDPLELEKTIYKDYYTQNTDLLVKFIVKNWDLFKESRTYSRLIIDEDGTLEVINEIFPTGRLIVELRRFVELIDLKHEKPEIKPTEEGLMYFLTPVIGDKLEKDLKKKINEQNPQTYNDFIDSFIYTFRQNYGKKDINYLIKLLNHHFTEAFKEKTAEQMVRLIQEQIKERIKEKKLERYEKDLMGK